MAETIHDAPRDTGWRSRFYFWLGLGLCLLGPILNVVLMQSGYLGLPWYMLALSTAGVGLMLFAVIQRARIGPFRVTCRSLFVCVTAGRVEFNWKMSVTQIRVRLRPITE